MSLPDWPLDKAGAYGIQELGRIADPGLKVTFFFGDGSSRLGSVSTTLWHTTLINKDPCDNLLWPERHLLDILLKDDAV